jgi:hypothetical protein
VVTDNPGDLKDIYRYHFMSYLSPSGTYLCAHLRKPCARRSFRYYHGFRLVIQDHVESRISERLPDLRICMPVVDRPYHRR